MARPTNKEIRYRYVGRTTKMTDEVVKKLEEAAAVRATVSESCFYAGISRETYYNWMKDNPQLLDRLNDLRQKPFLKARETIIRNLEDVNVAFKFLEKEKPDEYGDRLNINTVPGENQAVHAEDEQLRQKFKEELRANIRKRWEEKDKLKVPPKNETT